jgi:hypothetical protein
MLALSSNAGSPTMLDMPDAVLEDILSRCRPANSRCLIRCKGTRVCANACFHIPIQHTRMRLNHCCLCFELAVKADTQALLHIINVDPHVSPSRTGICCMPLVCKRFSGVLQDLQYARLWGTVAPFSCLSQHDVKLHPERWSSLQRWLQLRKSVIRVLHLK